MACCKPCCGCQDCAEGQEGKCCCGGAGGTCCQTGEYCCSGVCQNSPCEGGGACCLPDDTCVDNLTQSQCEQCYYACEQTTSVDENGNCPEGYAPRAPDSPECVASQIVQDCSGCPDGNQGGVFQQCLGPIGYCGTWHPNKTCADNPCETCFEQPLLGDEAYVDGWCAAAASSVGFVGAPCEFTTATCGTRTLVTDYGDIQDWLVTVCCNNPLP